MNKLFISCLFVAAMSIFQKTGAQINVSVNLDKQPGWGPPGYKHVDYYYLPAMDAYYDVPNKQFIYLKGNNWVSVPNPPANYRNVNLYRTYKVVVNEPKPYLQHNVYHAKYIKFKGNNGTQKTLKSNRGNHYGQLKNKHAGVDAKQAIRNSTKGKNKSRDNKKH